MPSVNIYLDEESYEIKKSIPKGEVSKIVQNAIKEYVGFEITMEQVKEKVRNFQKSEKNIKEELKIWKKRLKSMRIVEKDKAIIKEKEDKIMVENYKRETQKEKTKEYNALFKKMLEWFVIDDKTAKKLTEEIVKNGSVKDGKFIGWVNYVKSKGVKRRE